MSDTPRTDAIGLQYDSDTFSRRMTDFARQLERELRASTVYVEQLRATLSDVMDFLDPCPRRAAGAIDCACRLCRARAALAKNPAPSPAMTSEISAAAEGETRAGEAGSFPVTEIGKGK
jgi:hypothetical protein